MEADQDLRVTPPADDADRIAADLACIHCGYNLRTLSVAGVCPECGHGVAASVRCYGRESVEWLGTVADGASGVAACSTIEMVLLGLLCLPITRPGDLPCVLDALAGLTWLVLFLVLFPMTNQDPIVRHLGEGLSARRLLRVVVPSPPLCLIGLAMTFSIPLSRDWMAGILLALLCLSMIVLPLAMASYLRKLMQRISRPDLASWARVLFWVAAIVEIAVVAVVILSKSGVWPAASRNIDERALLITSLCLAIAFSVLLIRVARAMRAAYLQAKAFLAAAEAIEIEQVAAALSLCEQGIPGGTNQPPSAS